MYMYVYIYIYIYVCVDVYSCTHISIYSDICLCIVYIICIAWCIASRKTQVISALAMHPIRNALQTLHTGALSINLLT